MAYNNYLIFNEEKLPLPSNYNIEYITISNYNETEAGTIVRDVVRTGKIEIKVSFNASPMWVKKFSKYSKEKKLLVKYLDTCTLNLKETEMFMENFNVDLVKDTSYGSLWSVDFSLIEI